MKRNIWGVLLLFLFVISAAAQNKEDAIVGKWMSTEGNLLVEVYKCNNEFKAKVLWFDDTDDKSSPYYARCDTKNPNKSVRNQKILGMEVLHSLIYNSEDDRWEDGKIYDAKSGKTWDASAWITNDNFLKVRGFWHFEFLGESMKLKKYQSEVITKN